MYPVHLKVQSGLAWERRSPASYRPKSCPLAARRARARAPCGAGSPGCNPARPTHPWAPVSAALPGKALGPAGAADRHGLDRLRGFGGFVSWRLGLRRRLGWAAAEPRPLQLAGAAGPGSAGGSPSWPHAAGRKSAAITRGPTQAGGCGDGISGRSTSHVGPLLRESTDIS